MASVSTETLGAVRLIRYANPPRHYMTAEGTGQMLAAVTDAINDPAIRAIILTGTDDVFVRHYDVSELVAIGEVVQAGGMKPEDFEQGGFADLVRAIFDSPKPVIAAINGVCMGGGFEISLACDLRVAASSVPLIGLPATDWANELAGRGAEGLAHAKRLVRGALTWGLVEGTRQEQHGFHTVLKADSAMAAMREFLETGEDITR